MQWLLEERHVPTHNSHGKGGPLLTSKCRSPLAIALQQRSVDIVHYLVSQTSLTLEDELPYLSKATAVANFTALIQAVPSSVFEDNGEEGGEESKENSVI